MELFNRFKNHLYSDESDEGSDSYGMDLDQEMSRMEEMLLLGQDISNFFGCGDVDSRDVNGCTFLYCACSSGRVRLAELLLDIKASPNLASTVRMC